MSEWDFDGYDFVDDYGNPIEDDGYRDINDDPSLDHDDESNYDTEDDSWSDAETFTSIALSLGVNPKPFIVAVCFGASACFASPLGYQTNLLVYGPGNYRFSDYLKLGIPLNLMVIVMGTLLIPVFWPF